MGLDKFLNITYKLASSDNFGQYLDTMGVAEQVRDLILSSSPTIELTKKGDTYCCKTSSTLRDNEIIFKPGEEFDHVGIDGRNYRAVNTIDGNKITNNILSDPKSTVVSEFSADKVVLQFEANGVEASQIYEKI